VKFDLAILASEPLPAVVRQVQLAERLGYDTAWITDTHLVCRELWVTLAACAAATSRIRLGPGVTVPHSRHVSVTASAAASLHELAPGRVVVGIGTGGSSAQTMGLRLEQVGRAAALEIFGRTLPPRLARADDLTGEVQVAWLLGDRGFQVLAKSGIGAPEGAGRIHEVGSGESAVTSLPSNKMRPSVGVSRPEIRLRSVVLPQPDGPSSA